MYDEGEREIHVTSALAEKIKVSISGKWVICKNCVYFMFGSMNKKFYKVTSKKKFITEK